MQWQCEKLEKQAERGNIRGLFQVIKKLGLKFQPRFLNIRDKHEERGHRLLRGHRHTGYWKGSMKTDNY